jgi:serine protease AprX
VKKKTKRPLKKLISRLLSISCVLTLLVILVILTASANDTQALNKINANEKISSDLASKISETPATEKLKVIIVLKNQHSDFNTPSGKSKIASEQEEILDVLQSAKSNNQTTGIKSIHIVNAIAVEVTPDLIASLSNRSDVSKIEVDDVIRMIDNTKLDTKEVSSISNSSDTFSTVAWGVDKIGAPAVWQKGITGKGIIIAVVDSGVDATHPGLDDLDDNLNTSDPKVIGWIDYVNSKPSAYDDDGHGTHVSGTISGTGANGIQTGVAPGTNLIEAKVLDARGNGRVSNIFLAFDWAITNKARIINFSGDLYHTGEHEDLMTTAINNIVAAGVIPVMVAGNVDGLEDSITCPGDELNSLTVGATDYNDIIASFSRHGPVDLHGKQYVKPDISAPGVFVLSTYPGGGYVYESGTSMAAPHVSGTVALMLEQNTSLTPVQIRKILENTAVDLGSVGKDNYYGAGRINASKAVSDDKIVPVAGFSATPTSGKAPLNVAFTDKTTGTPTKWQWTFGDGTTSTIKNPTHKYSKTGVYTVSLTVKNDKGSNMITKTNYITVMGKPTAAFFASSTSGKAPLNVAFYDKSTGVPAKWQWNFGDGAKSSVQNPIHKYSKSGKYTVSLAVKNTKGSNVVTKTNYITVIGKPIAAFSASPTSGKAPLNVAFYDKSTGIPAKWQWNFGDGAKSSVQNPIHKYSKTGKYAVSLTVKNAKGSNTVTMSEYIIVSKK